MAGVGGYQAPAHPAPVSGPGAMSQRTDGQPIATLTDAAYGEQKTYRDIQQGAPVASGAPSAGGGAAPTGDPLAALAGLDAPTQMPDQPVTAGAAAGDGPGMDVLGLPQDFQGIEADDAQNISPGMLKAMIAASMRDDAPASFKRAVRVALSNRPQ